MSLGTARQVRPQVARALPARALHPGAWWLWAIGVGVAVTRTTNPVLLGLLAVAVTTVVSARRNPGPWGSSLAMVARLAVFVVGIRLVFTLLFGLRLPGRVLFTLPSVDLPEWAAGVSLGGPVTLEAVLTGLYEGLRLALLMSVFGAVNALTSPRRLLRSLPAVVHEAGVVVGAAMSFTPETVAAVGRVRTARRLRGRPTRGLAGLRGVLVPVLGWSLERSVFLATSMDARGYGRRGDTADAGARARRHRSDAALVVGLLLMVIGTYGVLDGGAPPVFGVPALLAGAAGCTVGFVGARARSTRTRHAPDRWQGPEWVVGAVGLAAAVVVTLGAHGSPQAAATPTRPPQLPVVTWWMLVAVVLVASAAVLSPPLPSESGGPGGST